MALVGRDALARVVQAESLFVVLLDDLVQFGPAEAEVGSGAAGEQVLDEHPAARLERQAEACGVVAEMFAEELADGDQSAVVHERGPPWRLRAASVRTPV